MSTSPDDAVARTDGPPPTPVGVFVRGLMMGTADVVPGVSGGTIALIVGIYARLLRAIRTGATVPVHLVREGLGTAVTTFREVEWRFLLPLAAGIGLALLTGAELVPIALERYPVQSRGLFLGLIIASLVVPARHVGTWSPRLVGLVAIAAVAGFLLVGLPPGSVDEPALPLVFLAAAVAICAMILPGISGSFLLVTMGMYEVSLRAVSDRDLAYIAVFVMGAVVGLGLIARLLEHLLARYTDLTMATLLGLMMGSLRALWPWQDDTRSLLPPDLDGPFATTVALVVVGIVLVGGLIALGHRRAAATDRG